MNLETIKAFIEIASVGSFQHAADNLNITQSAISARIKNLEDSLNRLLFVRKRNGVTLTSGGQNFYPHALRMIRTWELARQETALVEGLDDHIGLGIQINHWQNIAAPWLNWMNRNAAAVATQITADYSEQLMTLLRDGLLNLAIVCEPKQFADVIIQEYTHEQLVLVSSAPRSVQAGTVEGYVLIDWGRGFRADHGRAFPKVPSHKLTVGLAAVGLNHILQHGGSGYFLAKEVALLIAQEKLYEVTGAPSFSLTSYLCYLHDQAQTPAMQKALQGLQTIKTTSQTKR